MFRIAVLAATLIFPAFLQAEEAQLKGSVPTKDASQPTVEDKELRLRELVKLLKSLSDDDYNQALGRLPKKEAASPQLISRDKAIKSAYATLAALEYRQAAQAAPEEKKASYLQAYEKAAKDDVKSAAIDPGTLQETGWVLDLFKWLGNAALNYELMGGETFLAGRGVKDTETQKVDGLHKQLSGAALDPEKKADIHYQLGLTYQKMAGVSPEPPSDAIQTAKKTIKGKQLAMLLQSVSDDEYQEALKQLPAKTGSPAAPASRDAALKTTYLNLAALEYQQAAAQAPQESGAKYKGDYDRVATIQEAGWFTDFLGLAATGGIAYLIYENQRKHHDRGRRSQPQPQPQPNLPPPPPQPAGKPMEAIAGTVALWHFDEGSGTTLGDATGANNGLIMYNPQWVPGAFGKALSFNGTTQYVRAKAGLILGAAPAFTIEAWVKWEGNAPTAYEFIYGEGSYNDLIDMAMLGGMPLFTILSSNWMSARTSVPLTVGRWYHLATVLEGRVGKLYIDGALAATNDNMGPAIQSGNETDIGRCACNGGCRYFHGAIDEMRVLNVSRSPAEILADYRQGMGDAAVPAASEVGRSVNLTKTIDALETQLTAAELSPEKTAALHHKIGVIYEKLASVVVESAAEEPKPVVTQAAPDPKAATIPSPAPVPAPKPLVRRVVGPAAKDILLLWDGSRLDGELAAAGPEKIVLKTENGTTGIKQDKIQALILRGADVDAESEQALSSAAGGELPMILKTDGTSARGRLASVSPRQLVFRAADGLLTFSRAEVRAVVFPGAKK